MGNKVETKSLNPFIQKGYYHGLFTDVEQRTGLSRLLITRAIRNNDITTDKRYLAVKTAIDLVAENNNVISERKRELQTA